MNQLNKIFFIATLMCFALTTTAQWTPSSTGNTAGVTHCFIESSGILLSGGNGSGIFSSTNYGNTWTVSNTGIVAGEEILCLGKNSAGIFAGSDSLIYFSTNNGASWSIVNNSGNAVFAFAFLTDTIYAATMGGGVIMSTNNGSSWTTVNTGITTNLVYSIVKKGNLLFAGTDGNGAFVSSNAGANWTFLNSAPSTVRCLETDGTNIYAGTLGSGMFISSNNGASWSQVTNGIPITNFVYNITSIGTTLLAASHDVFHSSDSGATWTIFMNGINTTCPYGVAGFLETSSYVFCGIEGGCAGSVFRIDKNQVISGIETKGQNIFFSVFPNPTNQTATLKFNNSTKDNFTLTLFDSKGNLMRTVHNITADKVEIDRQNLTRGLYFFRLQSDKQIAIGKLTIE